ncbi:MAG: preprotein translocase subunit SecY [Candidatus Berkelbacteria bacterium]
MRFWNTLKQIFTMPDLRNRILYCIALLVIARVLAHVPLPGVDLEALRTFFGRNQIFGALDMLSGGAMQNFSIIMMGVGPYITASIIFQLLGMVVPAIDELNKEGESGRAKINHWTRLATVPLALVQAFAMIRVLQGQQVLTTLDPLQWTTILCSITAGTILLMWIGELISENGIGNGISLLIALGIVAGIPTQLRNTLSILDAGLVFKLIIFAVIAILAVAAIIMANEGTRQIPVSYARRVRGLKSYGGVDTHLPIRVNSAGVIPIIFAMSLLIFPGAIAQFLAKQATAHWVASAALAVERFLDPTKLSYGITYFLFVVLFTYFYTGVIFKPDQMAENLQKQGGFVPGIRPGKETAEYLGRIITRITLSGAVFLGVVAVLPYIVQGITKVTTLALGGTGVLIMVSVIIETIRQVQAQLSMRSYENY